MTGPLGETEDGRGMIASTHWQGKIRLRLDPSLAGLLYRAARWPS